MKKPEDITPERLDARIERLEEIVKALRERIAMLESHRCAGGNNY